MKIFRAQKGPFTEQPFYEPKDIEAICIQELQSVALYPKKPEPIRIDRFIEKRFNVVPEYEELEDGVLGLTVFGPKGVEKIVVAKALDQENTKVAERRIRTTLAHESGHGLLHAHLFLLASKQPQFDSFTKESDPKVLCRDIPAGTAERTSYDGRWWEYQANLVIGALLLPRPLVLAVLATFISGNGIARREEAALELAEVFNVNPAVAKIRIKELSPEISARQKQI